MRIHSIETLGAVDGPGLRCVVFLQGCHLRCRYCHNPDAQDFVGGREIAAGELRRRLVRMKEYFGPDHAPGNEHPTGGVTLSGGDPLASPGTTDAILDICRAEAIHTAIDTAGGFASGQEADCLAAAAKADMLLLDIKHPDPDTCRRLTGRGPEGALALLVQAERIGQPVWIRHVIAPGWSDRGTLQDLASLIRPYACVRRIELIGFHRLGCEKYAALGRQYPMGDTPSLPGRWFLSKDGDIRSASVAGTADIPPIP